MERLCIYMTYDKENKIYEYIGNVLRDLRECCSKIYLVCNSEKEKDRVEYVYPYVNDIFYRQNRGYDSGAYKDVLCDFLGWGEVCQYDELVLVNDSFFGFFYPLQDTFDLFDREDCDFWGMTGQSAGVFSNPSYQFDAHIHSYFLVFRRDVLRNDAFRQFWDSFSYPLNFREAVTSFEIGINRHLKEHGFKGMSYVDIYDIELCANENPCYSRLHELVKIYKVPIMKKKSVLIRNTGFQDTLNTVDFLKRENRYPVDWIFSFLENQFYIPGIGERPCNSLEFFYNKYSKIYIYGAGVCGKNLALYFAYKGWIYKGFIVTDSKSADVDAVRMEDAEIDSDTGIVISVLSADTAKEITAYIGGRCRREQLFYISDCDAIGLPD